SMLLPVRRSAATKLSPARLQVVALFVAGRRMSRPNSTAFAGQILARENRRRVWMPTMQAANTSALTISDSTNALRVGNVIVVLAHSKNGFSREVAPL